MVSYQFGVLISATRQDVPLSIFILPPSLLSQASIRSDFLLTDLQLSGAWTALSLEFSHDMAAEGGAGGESKISIRVHCRLVNTVSLRVFLVWRMAVVTRQDGG